MSQSFRISAAVLTLASVLCFANVASAQDAAPAGAPAAAPAHPGAHADRVKGDDEDEDDLKHFALTLNPLSLILTRVGINVEYMLARHHGLILNPFFQSISVGDNPPVKTTYTNVGAELGYRFYTGNRGANGFFIGPFATFMSSSLKAETGSASAESSISIYGGGVDLGGQHVFRNGFTIGGGGGLMYLTASEKTTESSLFKVSGVLPRFLFTLGWSF
jgi:hypothetical protein